MAQTAETERPGTDGDETDRNTVLRTERLTKKFGELTAVEDVALDIERGEFRSVIGPNGAGKTTLFNLVSGALSPTAGEIYFAGENVTGLDPYKRVRRGLARSFQLTTVFNGLTVKENVRLAVQSIALDGMNSRELLLANKSRFDGLNDRTGDVLARIGLAEVADGRASDLAYGDRRRLEIGLVLATDPEVVLLDEPTAGMSGEETNAIIGLIEEVLAEKTLVLVEHDVGLVMDISEHITVLHQGRVLASGTPAEISADEDVQEAYLGGTR
jgi:branched-chain amino acid transport system ATP-binding protein